MAETELQVILKAMELAEHVYLDAVDDNSWLKITKGTLEEYFDLLEVE